MRIRYWAIVATARSALGFALVAACVGVPERAANAAGGAYAVDDADIGPVGSCQNEAWVSLGSGRNRVGVESPACVVTLGIPFEIAGFLTRGVTIGDYATTVGGQAKAVPINNDRFAAGFAIGYLKDATAQRDIAFLNIPVTFKFGPSFRIHMDGGVIYDGRVDVTYAMGGVGFDWDFADRFSFMGEIYMQKGRFAISNTVTEPRFQLGLRYNPIPVIDLDFILGQNLVGRGAQWLTLGLTVRSQ